MRLARVVGQVVATVKEPELQGFKLLLVHDLAPDDPEGGRIGHPYLAVDLAGAGEGEVVVVAQGGAARLSPRTIRAPVDSAVVGIVDSIVWDRLTTFKKS